MKMTPEEFAQLKKDQPELFASESADPPAVPVVGLTQEQINIAIAESLKGVVGEAIKTAQEQVAQEAQTRLDNDKKLDAYLAGVAVPKSTKERLRAQYSGSLEYDEAVIKIASESAVAEFAEYAKAAGITGPKITGAGMTGSAQSDTNPNTTAGPGSAVALEAVTTVWGSPKSASKN